MRDYVIECPLTKLEHGDRKTTMDSVIMDLGEGPVGQRVSESFRARGMYVLYQRVTSRHEQTVQLYFLHSVFMKNIALV